MPKYIANGKTYNIPDDKVSGFEARYPDATVEYHNAGKTYQIPLSKRDGFLKQFPKASYSATQQEDADDRDFTFTDDELGVKEQDNLALQTATRSQIKELAPRVDSLLLRRGDELEAEQKRKEAEMPFLARLANNMNRGGGAAGMPTYAKTNNGRMADDEYLSLQTAARSLKNAQRIIDEADHNAASGSFDAWLERSFAGGAARGLGQKLFDPATWDMGVTDVLEERSIANALKTFKKGGELTEGQQALLDAKAIELATNAYFGSYVGKGYKAGQVTAEAIPFMLEMTINPASQMGKGAVSALTKYAFKRFGKEAAEKGLQGAANKVVNGIVRAAGDLAGAATMTATTGAVRTAADTQRRMTGDLRFSTDENTGYSMFAGAENGEEFGTAFAKAFGSGTIENYSEMIGEYFSPILAPIGKGIGKGFDWLHLGKVNQFINDVKMSEVGKIVTDFEKHAKWNGVFGEYAEEVVGGMINALTVGDQTLDSDEKTGVFNLERNIETFTSVALLGGFMSAAKTVGYRTPKHRARKELEAADIQAREKVQNWKEMKETLNSEDIDNAVYGVLSNKDLSSEQRRAILGYIAASLNYDGVVRGEAKMQGDGEQSPEQVDFKASFDNGYSLQTPVEMNDAKNMLDYKREQLRKIVGDKDIELFDNDAYNTFMSMSKFGHNWDDSALQAAREFVEAKATYDGMIQHVRDNIDNGIKESDAAIDARTNKTTGYVQGATMKVDDRRVYVISGHLVPFADGSGVDRNASDRSIIVRDAETGEDQMVSPDAILSFDEPIDPDFEKATAAEAIRMQFAQEAANKIDGVAAFNPGDTYTITGDDGQIQVQIVANEQEVVDNGDGTVNVSDGTNVFPLAKETIQQQVDMANIARVTQFEQARAAENAEVNRPQYVINDLISLSDENGNSVRGSITADADADGRFEVYTESPINGKRVNLFTRDELDNMLLEHNGVEVAKTQPDNAEQTPTEVVEKEPIPVEKRGKEERVAYHVVPIERTMEEIHSMDLTPQEIGKFIAANIKEIKGDISSLEKKTPEMGADINAYKQAKSLWNEQMAALKQKLDYYTELQNRENEVYNSEMQAAVKAIKPEVVEMTADEFIANNMPKITPESFKRETGLSNSEQRGLVGIIAGADKGGMSIEQAAEVVLENYGDELRGLGFNGDVQDVRDMIINILSSGNPRSYAKKGLEIRMSEDIERQRAELGYIASQMHFETIEEQIEYEQNVNPRIIEDYKDFDEEEYFNILAQNYDRNDTTGESESIGRSGNVLQRERVIDNEGVAGLEQPGQGGEVQGDVYSGGENAASQGNQQPVISETPQPANEMQPVANGDVVSPVAEVENQTGNNTEMVEPAGNEVAVDSQGNLKKPLREIISTLGGGQEHTPTIGELVQTAEAEVNTTPTDKQKEAGNYKKGHVQIGTFNVTIEQPRGSVRSGVDKGGKKWEVEMQNTYGYIRGTEGVDGDHIDVFLSNDIDGWNGRQVYVIDQRNADGSFDEHKVMLGFNDINEAEEAYLSNYEQGWQGLGAITGVAIEDFEMWIASSHRKTKAFAEYKSVKTTEGQSVSADIDKRQNLAKFNVGDVVRDYYDHKLYRIKKHSTNGVSTIAELDAEGNEVRTTTMNAHNNSRYSIAETPTISQDTDQVSDAAYSIAPAQYTTKKGKVLDMHLVKFTGELTKEQQTAAKELAKADKGWYDREQGGFMMRSEESAKQLANTILGNEEAVSEAQPVSMTDIQALNNGDVLFTEPGQVEQTDSEEKSPVWQYTIHVDKETGRTTLRRDDVSGVYPIGDARWQHTAASPEEMLDILRNPLNGMQDVLEAVGVTLENKIKTRKLDRKSKVVEPQQVNVESLFNALSTNGEAKLSDHVEQQPATNPSGNRLVTDERYAELRERMRKKLGGEMNIGIDPEILAIGTEMAVYHLEKGARKFTEFAKAMIADLGDAIRPYLKAFYNGARDLPEVVENGLSADMTTYDEVQTFDVANFDKPGIDALATAETVARETEVAKEVDVAKERIKKSRQNKDNKKNSVTSQQEQLNLFENGAEGEIAAADNNGTQLEREELPDTEQVGAGVPVQNTARNSKSKRRNAGVGSSELGNGPQYDVNRNYTNEEIEEIVSSVTDIVDGKVVITGEVTDDIKAIVRGYESGGIAKKGRGILDEYYTDGKIVDAVNLLIAPYFNSSTPIRVLEPSVGIGNFIQAVNNIPTSEVVAFEINETTARIAKILYPDVDVNLRSFETEFIDESGNKKPMPQKYNLVIGNPPYGSHRGLYKGLGEESKIARYEDYFVKRSLDVLDEGGVLAMVLPSSWMDRHTEYGGYTIERAYRLPSGAFEATQVGTDIVILKKNSSVPVTEHAPYFEQFPERVLGEVKQRKGRYGRLEEYVEGDIDAAIEAIKKENAEQVADLLDIEKNNDALNDIESAVDETGSPEKAVAIVKDAQESEKADKKPAKKPSGKQGKYKVELNRGVETVPTSAQFTHEFSEGEVEAFADTDYEGALSNPAKHRRYANYIGGQAIHDFYYAEGDIYSKLAQLEQEKGYIVENYGVEQYEKQKALLESVLPKQKSLEEITISPNTTFVKNLNILTEGGRVSLKDMFVDFLRKLPRQAFGNSSSWEVVGYINNEQVHGTDKQRNQLIRERRKRVANDLFNKFLSEELSDNAKKQVVAAFNREYNSTYRPDYSKVPMFSTINKDFKGRPLKLTSVQLAGIGRMTVKGVGVLAHEVGFGKTLSGILAMHEAMTRGFAKKPLIVVPNDNILKQWVETIGEVLPNATVNTLGNLGAGYDLTDFKVNDGEFTIITYEGLKAMSFSDGTYNHLASKFSYITEDLNKHQSERDIQKEIEKKNELKGKMKRGTKSSYMFEDFSFDWLTVDEVHNANHIVSKVRLDKSVASDFRSQSQRTSDLGLKTWLAAQYIQEENNGRNVLLLSATPFTNKPLEYYSILSLVGNDMLERKGFFNVDQFFATFMEADNELEIGANGRPTQKTNVRRFRNNGLFQQLLSEFIDIKGEEDNPELVRPERLNKEYKIAQNELTAEAMAAAQELLSDNDTVLQGIGHARAAAFSPYATSLLGMQPKNHKEFVKNSPKIDATIKMIEQNLKDRPDAGQIIYSEVGVEFFPLIRDYLVKESGLKPNEVRIITGATSNNERVNIQAAFNNGEIKVVIGSPAIKEGLNLQGNTTDMYILSLPWNFTQLRQIEGRGWRQGNRWENIRINYMLTNDSVDVFMLQRLHLKQGLYNEAMKSGAESLDVSDIDTSELKTALITDPAVRAEIVTVQERAKLQQEKTQIEADLSFVMRKYEAYNKLVEKLGSQKNTIKMYREWAKKGDEYWGQRAEREEAQLTNIENEIEEEKQNLLKKGVNVDDIVRQTEQAHNAIAAIQEKIDNLEEFQEELTQKFREESKAKAKEQGDLVSTYIKERKAENKGGFYKIRPVETETKATEEDAEDGVLYRTSEEIEAEYPNWLDGTTTESGKHSTQVEGTRKTYKKVADWIEENMGKDVAILDASSGMGYGTADLRERGFNIEDVEPYQSEDRKQSNPATYSSYEDIDKQYDFIISNAVLNVIPDDWRADVLHNMADKLKTGGKIFINTRKAGEERSIKDKIELDSPQEVLVKRNGKIASYQRFFTPIELKEWVENELGEGYSVEIANKINSGTGGLAAVVVTKNNESPANGKTSESGQPISNHKGMANASLTNVSAKVGKNTERANRLDAIISSIEEFGEMGPHEFLHEVVNAMLLSTDVSTTDSRYAKLGGGVTLRLADHYGNASNYKGRKDAITNYGLVVKISTKAFVPDNKVDYLEYVYFPDKLTKERQIEIVQGLKAFIDTGRYELLPNPDKIHTSGKFGSGYSREGAGPLTDRDVVMDSDPYSKALGRPRYTGKKMSDYVERQRTRMAQRVQDMAQKLNIDIEVLQSTEGLTGKKALAKGWFDPKTNKVRVVIPNHTSVGDVMETVLHEAVAHYGLRKLFGEHFDTFLDNVFNNADEAIRRQISDLAIQKYNFDFRKATEEYLASLAENMEFENAQRTGWWRKIKELFLKMLHKIGFEGFSGTTLSDNELRYILWRSYKNLEEPGAYNNVFATAEDIAKQSELKVGNYAVANAGTQNVAEYGYGYDDDMYRDGDPEIHERVLARDRYERRIKSGWYQSQEALQDSMLGLKEAMQAILGEKAYIEDVDGFENAYLGENRLSSVNKAEADAFAHTLFKPMLDEVAKLAPTEEARTELIDYMFAKHGIERTRDMSVKMALTEPVDGKPKFKKDAYKQYLAEKEAVIANGKSWAEQYHELNALASMYGAKMKDVAGLVVLTETGNIDDAMTAAYDMVNEYERTHNANTLWKRVNDVSKAVLQKSYESGLMSKEVYNEISKMYQFYIPLRGFDEDTSSEAYAYLTHKEGAFNAPIKKAKGRSSKADDPFANLQSMAESTIMQGNRNKLVKQRFLNFVLNHPSDLVSVNELWLEYDEVADEWRPVFPDNIKSGDSAEVVEQKMRDFEMKMEALAEKDPDKYKRGKDAVDIPYKVVADKDMKEHQVIVKRNGRDYVMTINGNPRAAQALNGQTNPDNDMSGAIGAILRAGEKINRQLSAFYTTRNPDFVVSNFMRDLLYTNTMVWIKESPNYALRFHRNYLMVNPVAMKRLLARYRKGELDMNDKTDAMFYQFMMNGGETGYANIRDIEQHKNDIKRELKRANTYMPVQEAWSLLAEQLDELNRAVENCARFAAFVTSREMGRSIDRAVYDAKEISVNFNKKGSGAKFLDATGQTRAGNASAFVSGIGRSGYVFWNAAIQGTTNFGRQIKRHPAKAFTGMAAMFLLGAIIAYLGGDDEEDDKNAYYNLPEYVRRTNILFRAGDSWISIPLPIEYRAMYGMGELMMSVLSGKEHFTGGEIAEAIAAQMTQILPLDFLEGGGGWNAFVPSIAKPVVEAFVIEKSWTGMPLYKDTPFNKNKPEWTKAYKSANKYIVGLAAALNEATGGDAHTKGWIDINPAKIEYMLNGYFSGVTGTIDKMVKTVETVAGIREYDPRSIPLWNRLVKAGDERTEYRAVNNEYFRLKKEHDVLKERLRSYEKDTDNGIFDYAEKIDFLYNSPEYARYEIFEDYRKDIDDLYDELQEAETYGDKDEVDAIEAELNGLKKMMIHEMNWTRDRK